MHTVWTKNLADNDEKQRFENSLQGSETVLNRLKELLDEKIAEIDRSNLTLRQYQSPNWAFETAHKNGMISAYNAVKDLVTIKDQ